MLLLFALALPGNELVLSLRVHIDPSAGKARAPTELQVDVGVVLLLFETCLLSLFALALPGVVASCAQCPSASKVTAPAKLQVKVGSVLSPLPFFRCACVVAGP